jgi:phosphoenolpyruvate carboxylase
MTPIAELSSLRIGSRPAARGEPHQAAPGSGAPSDLPAIADLRAIPWVFAWSQARVNLPGWYGLGAALEGFIERHGAGAVDELAELYRSWPFFASVIDNAEMILAKADRGVARNYAALVEIADGPRIWSQIDGEFERSVRLLLMVTGRARLLDGLPVLQRSIGLRNPYVDSLSELQVRLLARLRRLPADDPQRPILLRLVQTAVNGVAAGLQNTG